MKKSFIGLFDYLDSVKNVNLFETQQSDCISLDDLETGTPVRVAYRIHDDGTKEFDTRTWYFYEYDELHGALITNMLDGDDPAFDDQYVTLGQLELA